MRIWFEIYLLTTTITKDKACNKAQKKFLDHVSRNTEIYILRNIKYRINFTLQD
jgi:hypothetical protein